MFILYSVWYMTYVMLIYDFVMGLDITLFILKDFVDTKSLCLN